MIKPIIVKEFKDKDGNSLSKIFLEDLVSSAEDKAKKMKTLWFEINAYEADGKEYKGLLTWNKR